MQYRIEIDKVIFEQLAKSSSGGVQSGDLKKSIESILAIEELSWDVFSRHIKQLKAKNIISAKDQGRGKPIVYSLTDEARKKRYLQILGNDKMAMLRRRILLEIFKYAGVATEPERFRLEEDHISEYFVEAIAEMEDRFNSERASIIRKMQSRKEHGEMALVYYKKPSETRQVEAIHVKDNANKPSKEEILELFRSINDIFMNPKKFFREKKDSPFDILENIQENHRNIGPAELVQEIKFSYKNSKLMTEYYYTLNGISPRMMEESLVRESNDEKELSHQDIENAFLSLKENGYIELTGMFGDDMIYNIADGHLTKFLNDLKWTSDRREDFLLYKRKYTAEWSRKDEEWLVAYCGSETANKQLRDAELSGYDFRKKYRLKRGLSGSFIFEGDAGSDTDYVNEVLLKLNSLQSEFSSCLNLMHTHRDTIEKFRFLKEVLGPLYPELYMQ